MCPTDLLLNARSRGSRRRCWPPAISNRQNPRPPISTRATCTQSENDRRQHHGVTMTTSTLSAPARRAPSRFSNPLIWVSAASIVGGLALWEFAGRFVVKKALFLTTPTQIIAEIIKLSESGMLQVHVWTSAKEFVLGLVIAIMLGIGVGFAMASSEIAKRALGPWVS